MLIKTGTWQMLTADQKFAMLLGLKRLNGLKSFIKKKTTDGNQ